MHMPTMPNWVSNLASDFASQNRNGRIQFWIRFRTPILDPISESTTLRATRPTTIRIQTWIRNWVAGFRPSLPPPGGVRATWQMLADHKPDRQPFALDPQLGIHPHPCPQSIMRESAWVYLKTLVVSGPLPFQITCPKTIHLEPTEHAIWQQTRWVNPNASLCS